MKPSLRANLTLKMTVLFVGALLVLGAVAFWRAQLSVSDLADRFIRQNAASIDDKIQVLLDRTESNAHLLAGLVAPTTKTSPTLSDASSFPATAGKLLELMSANPEYGAVSFTLERTGETVKVVQMPSGALVIQMVRISTDGVRVRHDYVPFGEQLRQTHEDREIQTDDRRQVWYTKAKDTAEPFWTETYLIPNTAKASSPGVTYALPIFDRNNTFLGVATVDFTIADLSGFIDRIEVGTNGYAALLEYDEQGRAKVIAHPQKNRLIISEGGRERLATIPELDDPVMSSLAETLDKSRSDLQQDEPSRRTVSAGGKRYQVGFQAVSGERRPSWLLAVVLPDDEFMGSVWQTGAFLAVFGAVAIIAVVGISYVVAQRVAKPLQELVVETGRVKSFDLEPRALVPSNVREVEELAGAMEQMKTGLRSLEKLVPADYARWLMATGQEAKLGGDRRRITTYFADIIGFTALSEKMEPEDLVEVLAEYLDVLSGEVLRFGGTVDKFNGDDVMAFWGAPNPTADHAFLACKSAITSQSTLEHLHTEWRGQGRPLLRASFGISTGDVIVGNVGSRHRMNYTVIGDAVNLASRLQGLNKFYSTEILLGEQTVIEAGDRVVTRLVDWALVAGRGVAVPVFELLALSESARPETMKLSETHNRAMSLYRSRDFDGAIPVFQSVLQDKPHDGPARILLARCEHFLTEPPSEDWDGAVQLAVK